MMLYSVHDRKAEAFSIVMCFPARGSAMRHFQDQVNDPQSNLNKHAEDYTLYEIGVWDESVGKLVALEEAVNLGAGSSYLNRPQGVE